MYEDEYFRMHLDNLDIKLLPVVKEIVCEVSIRNNERQGIFFVGDKQSLSLEQILEKAKLEGIVG